MHQTGKVFVSFVDLAGGVCFAPAERKFYPSCLPTQDAYQPCAIGDPEPQNAEAYMSHLYKFFWIAPSRLLCRVTNFSKRQKFEGELDIELLPFSCSMMFPESKSCRCPCDLGSAGQAGIGELHERGGDSSFARHGWHRKPGDLCNYPRYLFVGFCAWEERLGLLSYSCFIGIDSSLVRYTLTSPGDLHQQSLVIKLH